MSASWARPKPSGTARRFGPYVSAPGAPAVTDRFSAMEPAAVIAAMQNPQLQSDADQASAACKRLRVLCRHDGSAQLCSQLGACEIVHFTMQQHPDDPAVQLQALAVFVNLCAAGPEGSEDERRKLSFQSGVLRSVLAAMEKHTANRAIQEMGFMAIYAICYGDDEEAVNRKAQAITLGALRSIVAGIIALETTEQDAWHLGSIQSGKTTLMLLCDDSRENTRKALQLGAKKSWFEWSNESTSLFASMSALQQQATNRRGAHSAREHERAVASSREASQSFRERKFEDDVPGEPASEQREHPGRDSARLSGGNCSSAASPSKSPRDKVEILRAAMQRTERKLEQQASKLAAAERALAETDGAEPVQPAELLA